MLKGKAAVVTGAGRGLGCAYAQAMAAVGGDCIIQWPHPSEMMSLFEAGGWTSEDAASIFPAVMGTRLQEFRAVPVEIPQPARPVTKGTP